MTNNCLDKRFTEIAVMRITEAAPAPQNLKLTNGKNTSNKSAEKTKEVRTYAYIFLKHKKKICPKPT